ncbi:hypothetical protein MO973_29585, partial [Paenibacillus sp. TRM 82003]|nr:hypothetical protein [Paenibacillus sp. TRM 82003]
PSPAPAPALTSVLSRVCSRVLLLVPARSRAPGRTVRLTWVVGAGEVAPAGGQRHRRRPGRDRGAVAPGDAGGAWCRCPTV